MNQDQRVQRVIDRKVERRKNIREEDYLPHQDKAKGRLRKVVKRVKRKRRLHRGRSDHEIREFRDGHTGSGNEERQDDRGKEVIGE